MASFTDDYDDVPERRVFAVDEARALLRGFHDGRSRNAIDLLGDALQLTEGALMPACLGLHTVLRVLARGRDRRLHPDFDLSIEQRLRLGLSVAGFDEADAGGGDPLGDAYHFWANVSAGVFAETSRSRGGALLVASMLRCGPWLMKAVREGVFGSQLFYGNHARIDRWGLRIGRAMAKGLIARTALRLAPTYEPHSRALTP